MRRLCLTLAALLFTVTLHGAAQAQWKWRDSQGRVTVSDLPPPRDVAEKDILSRPAPPARRAAPAPVPAASAASAAASGADSGKARVDPELEARKRKAEQDQLALRKQEETKLAAARAENCERAKVQLRTLESGVRAVRVNEKGEREILDDKQRADEMQRARSAMASDCR